MDLPRTISAKAAGPIKHVSMLRLVTGVFLLYWAFPAVVIADTLEDAASAAQIFSCSGRASGYYADLQSGCQKYHMCDAGGRIYTYSCPNRTLFQQRVMICDHWFMVDCSLSENYFSANLLIGQKDKQFMSTNEEFYRRNQEESTLHRRNQQRTPVNQQSTTTYGTSTTPYPWRRTASTSGAAAARFTKENSAEKSSYQFGDKKIVDDKVSVIKYPLTSKKGITQSVTQVKKEERVVPKEYANNPFFRGFTAGPLTNSQPTTNKGQYDLLTSPSPIRKDHQNLFAWHQHSNGTYTSTPPSLRETTRYSLFTSQTTNRPTFSTTTVRGGLHQTVTFPNNQEFTPKVITTKSPSTFGHSFVTPQGQTNQFVNDSPDLRNAFSNGIIAKSESISESPLTTRYEFITNPEVNINTETPIEVLRDDLGVNLISLQHDDEELSANTVELRIPDTRHMFYIADNPTRQAEMMNTNNETVLTINLSAPKHHGAMRFKDSKNAKGRRDDCPQCHPAFLLPGKCQPCVLIR